MIMIQVYDETNVINLQILSYLLEVGVRDYHS